MLRYILQSACIALTTATLTIGCADTNDSPSATKAQGQPKGTMRGVDSIEKQITSNLMGPMSQNFKLTYVAGRSVSQMQNLLGAWIETNQGSRFLGGEPNPFGLVLWSEIFSRFATTAAERCNLPQGSDDLSISFDNYADGFSFFSVSSNFAKVIDDLCQSASEEALENSSRHRQHLNAVWYLIMGFSAPDSERKAFVEYFEGVKGIESEQYVEDILLAIFLNPYFLLES